jgi:hypothetical protein
MAIEIQKTCQIFKTWQVGRLLSFSNQKYELTIGAKTKLHRTASGYRFVPIDTCGV